VDSRRRFHVASAALAIACAAALTTFMLDRLLANGEPAAARPKPPSPASRTRPRLDHPLVRVSRPNVRLMALGDLTFGSTPSLPNGGAAGLLGDLRPVLRQGEVVLGNLETPLTNQSASKCGAASSGCYAFRAPPAYAAQLRRVGFTVLNLANNHALDRGAGGQVETVSALAAAGLRHTGRPGEVALQRVGATRVAIVGFAPYPWAQDLRDLDGARRLVEAAARRADLVIVTMHAGAEGSDRGHVSPGRETYLGEDRGDVVAFAHAVVEAGADLVVGHGPHVVRGIERYRGRLIAYSLGNASGHGTLSTDGVLGAGALLDATLRANGSLRRARVVSLRLVDDGRPVLDRTGEAAHLVRDLSRADFGRRAAVVSSTGAIGAH
jgi:Bacterial capsule synthesis protein PGA_cap